MERKAPTPVKCQNCGSTSVAKFCANCGQDTRETRRPLNAMGFDWIGGVGHKGKLWATLIPLVTRPGHLTNEYIAGRRVRYFHPRKMYFFVSIVFFLLFALLKKDPRALSSSEIVKTATDMAHTANAWNPRLTVFIEKYVDLPDTGPTLRVRLARQLQYLQRMDPELLQERFSRSVATNTPRMVFLLLPVFALVIMAFHRRRYYIEHLMFAFHTHIYVFGVATAALVYEYFSHDARGARYGLLIAVPYLFLSARAVYEDSWPLTAAKLIGAMAIYAAILGAGTVALVAIAFWQI